MNVANETALVNSFLVPFCHLPFRALPHRLKAFLPTHKVTLPWGNDGRPSSRNNNMVDDIVNEGSPLQIIQCLCA